MVRLFNWAIKGNTSLSIVFDHIARLTNFLKERKAVIVSFDILISDRLRAARRGQACTKSFKLESLGNKLNFLEIFSDFIFPDNKVTL